MAGILYVVATPIGNLEDVTLRALRILREVALIAAEDTRRTAKLLQHYSISTSTTSLHEHNERARVPRLVERLQAGESIALVSDAGTPGVSDPGAQLVAAALAAGITVQPVPGPTAVAALVSVSGLDSPEFSFVGFAPSRSNDRIKWLRGLIDHPYPFVFFEAPHRIRRTLQDVRSMLGERLVSIGRELTKVHEFSAVRPISAWLSDPPPDQGEFVLLVRPAKKDTGTAAQPSPEILAAEFWSLTKSCGGLARREALRHVARQYGVSVKAVYIAVEGHPRAVD